MQSRAKCSAAMLLRLLCFLVLFTCFSRGQILTEDASLDLPGLDECIPVPDEDHFCQPRTGHFNWLGSIEVKYNNSESQTMVGTVPSLKHCADACLQMQSCRAFVFFHQARYCTLYSQSFHRPFPGRNLIAWYFQIECCQPASGPVTVPSIYGDQSQLQPSSIAMLNFTPTLQADPYPILVMQRQFGQPETLTRIRRQAEATTAASDDETTEAEDEASEAADETTDAGDEASEADDGATDKATKAAGKTTEAAGKATKAAGKTTEAAGKATKAAGKTTEAAGKATKASGKTTEAQDEEDTTEDEEEEEGSTSVAGRGSTAMTTSGLEAGRRNPRSIAIRFNISGPVFSKGKIVAWQEAFGVAGSVESKQVKEKLCEGVGAAIEATGIELEDCQVKQLFEIATGQSKYLSATTISHGTNRKVNPDTGKLISEKEASALVVKELRKTIAVAQAEYYIGDRANS
ncbi:hypothetical protein Ciccas_013792 [Cichlidogyrus casuarinus]|uniref:Apple domain-containing protein n=1 Tax=Cichlidogyrus casuarinus TaxID=1844966 RepID=A0ABD2PKD4_9PLAT